VTSTIQPHFTTAIPSIPRPLAPLATIGLYSTSIGKHACISVCLQVLSDFCFANQCLILKPSINSIFKQAECDLTFNWIGFVIPVVHTSRFQISIELRLQVKGHCKSYFDRTISIARIVLTFWICVVGKHIWNDCNATFSFVIALIHTSRCHISIELRFQLNLHCVLQYVSCLYYRHILCVRITMYSASIASIQLSTACSLFHWHVLVEFKVKSRFPGKLTLHIALFSLLYCIHVIYVWTNKCPWHSYKREFSITVPSRYTRTHVIRWI
jgi:hypothetical protein